MRDATKNDGFPCDVLLASQWLDRRLPCFTDVPERRLLVAILLDAVRCLQVGGKPQREVLAWVRGDYSNARIPFQSLCDGLDIEEAPLARRLALQVASDVKRRRVSVQRMSGGGRHIGVVGRAIFPPPPPVFLDPLAA